MRVLLILLAKSYLGGTCSQVRIDIVVLKSRWIFSGRDWMCQLENTAHIKTVDLLLLSLHFNFANNDCRVAGEAKCMKSPANQGEVLSLFPFQRKDNLGTYDFQESK